MENRAWNNRVGSLASGRGFFYRGLSRPIAAYRDWMGEWLSGPPIAFSMRQVEPPLDVIIISATRQKNVRQKNKNCHFSVSHFSVWSVWSGRNDDQSRRHKIR
jgi:hypothetical protein